MLPTHLVSHKSKIFVAAIAAIALLAISARAATSTLGAADFMKIRCNTSGQNAITSWHGNVTTTGVAADKSQTLFKIVGYNIARCFKDTNGNWTVGSRELTFYLDPSTGEVLDTWQNPWTKEIVPVVHIANALVQQKILGVVSLPVESSGNTSILRIDVPLSYPNPLAGDARFADYSPEPFYKAHESFSYVVANQDLAQIGEVDAINDVQVVWTRVSPWLPWMKMKGAAGQLVFNAIVQKHEKDIDMPDVVKKRITNSDLELYLDAPRCVVSGRPNVSSWTYFKDHFDAYLKGEMFPVSEPASSSDADCAKQ
ncbi:DUF1838 domain-containing protein [bacterium]|nr:DUF1838 domain-containing protein [bacterium]